MQLGIVTRYAHAEAAYVAIRLADWGRLHGHTVRLHSTLKAAPCLLPRWDAQARDRQPMRERLSCCDTIIWVGVVPTQADLAWAQKGSRRTGIFCLWHELDPHDRPSYKDVTCVICPSVAAARLLQARWSLDNISIAPFDPGAPICSKAAYIPKRPRLLLPLHGYEAYHTEATALTMLERALEAFQGWDLAVTQTPSHTASFGKRRLDALQARFPTRVKVHSSLQLDYLPAVFHAATVTLWPTHSENTGMSGLLSLTAGTPIIAFALTPLTEFARDDNAVLVPCREDPTPCGVPAAVPCYEQLEAALFDTMARPDKLREMQEHAAVGLAARRDIFDSVLLRAVL